MWTARALKSVAVFIQISYFRVDNDNHCYEAGENSSRSANQMKSIAVASAVGSAQRQRRVFPGWIALVIGVYNWLLWMMLGFLIFSQLLGIIWNYTTVRDVITYGQSPLLGTYSIPGLNDEPYSDRVIVCMHQGRHYNPMTVNDALNSTTTQLIDTNGSSIDGYRVVKRSTIGIDPARYAAFANVCDEITDSLDNIAKSCAKLGYHVLQDGLRIVDDVMSTDTYYIPDALPVLIMPYWDNALACRFVIPGTDGSACMFRVRGRFYPGPDTNAWLMAVNRTTREQRTREWLGQEAGRWRNGWYEDESGGRWYSDIFVDRGVPPLNVGKVNFDLDTYDPEPVVLSSDSAASGVIRWGHKYYLTEIHTDVKSVAVANGYRYGLFLYSSARTQITASIYDIETFVSNASVLALLFRWMVVMITLQISYFQHKNPWENAGVGCLSCSQTFLMLPVIILPRLKTTLMAFFSLGCAFEGNQKVYVEAWFVMYPGIAEFVLLYFSILNLLAMWSQRRVSDALFGPTLLFFCTMHYVRQNLAESGWFEFDGRITALITPEFFDELRLIDFFTTDVTLRINGNVKSMFLIKLGVLALNLVPLFLFSTRTSASGRTAVATPLCSIERVLSTSACCSGGLGSRTGAYHGYPAAVVPASMFSSQSIGASSAGYQRSVKGYELLRLGYVMLGNRWLIPLTQWHFFAVFSLTKWTREHFNLGVLLIEALPGSINNKSDAKHEQPVMNRLDNPRLANVCWWQISISPCS